MSMTEKEKLTFLENMMEMDNGELDVNDRLDSIEEWDSISKLALMTAVKKLNNKVITIDELKGFQTVKDICDYLG